MIEIRAEDLVGEEWAEWYRLTPQQRFFESMKLWDTYLALGGSLEPEPDTQSPVFAAEFSRDLDLLILVDPANLKRFSERVGRAGLRIDAAARLR